MGIGGAVQTGYLYAFQNGYDIAVQFDGDGQHDAAYLNEMADYLVKNECDMVIGSRFIEKEGFQSSQLRRVGIVFFSKIDYNSYRYKNYRSNIRTSHDWT